MKNLLKPNQENWKPLKNAGLDIEKEKPYWLKLKNGKEVLAAVVSTEYVSGWAAVDWNTQTIDANRFYIAKDAMIQEIEE